MTTNDTILDNPPPDNNEPSFHLITLKQIIIAFILLLLLSIIISLLTVLCFSNKEKQNDDLECVSLELMHLSEEINKLKGIKQASLQDFYDDSGAYAKLEKKTNEDSKQINMLLKKIKKQTARHKRLLKKAHKLYYYHQILMHMYDFADSLEAKEKISLDLLAKKISALNSLIKKAEEHGGNLPTTAKELENIHLLILKSLNSPDQAISDNYYQQALEILEDRIKIIKKTIASISLPDN